MIINIIAIINLNIFNCSFYFTKVVYDAFKT